MTPTLTEILLIAMPLPTIAGVVIYLIWRRRHIIAMQAVEGSRSIGTDLANQIAEYLEGGLILAFRHKEYCGVGLRFAEGRYVYGHVADGDLPTPTEFAEWGWSSYERREFLDRASFVSWLATETTNSLAGDGNQRLTRGRLVDAARFCSQHPKEQWPRYAG